MATVYNIKCINNTKESYFFGVYQEFPESPGLKSVAWQVRGVPPAGSIPSTSDITWTMTYGVSVANWDPNGKTYTGQQIVNAQLGKVYEVKMTELAIPTINPIPVGNTDPEQIELKNETSQKLDLGFTVDNSLMAVQSVHGGEGINFVVHPTYYVATYRSIQQGQLVDSGIQLGPVEVKYENGYTKAEVLATVVAGKYQLMEPVYVSPFTAFANPELSAAASASAVHQVGHSQRKKK